MYASAETTNSGGQKLCCKKSILKINHSIQSKKSPRGPTERTPRPEYLIALAIYLGVRWKGPIQFLMDPTIGGYVKHVNTNVVSVWLGSDAIGIICWESWGNSADGDNTKIRRSYQCRDVGSDGFQQQLQVMFPNSSTTRPQKNKGSLKAERNVKETTPATPTPSPKKQQFFHGSLANSDGMPPPRRDPSRSSFLMMEILSPQAPLKYHLNCWESKQTFGVVTSSHK